ncbi:MAG: hypothetical protein LBI35_05165 [Burkholderiales bacterium]|jgi:hypothetical protein|nr:hypothetical protein [Burkholderiales bacterium]
MAPQERKALDDLIQKWEEKKLYLVKAGYVLPDEDSLGKKFFGFGSGTISSCIRDLKAFLKSSREQQPTPPVTAASVVDITDIGSDEEPAAAIHLFADFSEYVEAINLLTQFLKRFPKVGKRLVRFINTSPKIACVNVDRVSSTTFNYVIVFKRSYSLAVFSFACRRLNVNR